MEKKCRFMEGLLAGAALGALAGILLAPSSGEETRRKIKKMVEDNNDLIRDTKEKTEVLIAKTMSAIEQGFDKIGQVVDEGRKNKSRFPKDADEMA